MLSAKLFCSILCDYCHHLLHTQYCHRLYLFAVYCTAIAIIRHKPNIAMGYMMLQYIVRLLPPFATHKILLSAIPFCSILYGYCHHSIHTQYYTQYCHQLYHFAISCAAIAAICYTLNIAVGYILLQYLVRLLPSFAADSILPLAIELCSIFYSYCCSSYYSILQYTVQLLPPFATHSILPLAVSLRNLLLLSYNHLEIS